MKNNWQIQKINEVCSVGAGNSAPQKNEFFIEGKYPFFRTSDVGGIHIGKISYSNDYLNDRGIKGLKLFRKGTILLPKSGASTFLNHRVVMAVDGYVSSHLATIKVDEKLLDNNFLFYFLQEIKAQDLIQDHKYPSLNLPIIGNIEVPIPPLSEQQRIVKILEENFEKIEKAKENAAKNLQNSKELFDYYLNNIFTDNNSNEVKKLSEVAEYFNGLTYSPKNVSSEGTIVLRSSNVQNDELDFSDIVRVNLVVKDKIIVQDGDILMCSRNGSKRLVGKTATIKNLTEKMTFGTFMMVVRSKYNPYISWFFKSTYFRKQISGGENTMINQITRYMLDDVTLYFPSPKVQNEIIEKLGTLSAETKKLESIYKQKLANLEELKKSILKKAFDGEL